MFQGLYKKLFFSSLVVFTFCLLLYYLPLHSRRNWEMCKPQTSMLFVPIVEDISRHSVTLGGGSKLWEGGRRLQFLHSPEILDNIWLIFADGRKAKFAYEHIEDYGGRAPGDQQRIEIQCQYEVPNGNNLFESSNASILSQPDDFDTNWQISDYIEYYFPSSYRTLSPDQKKGYFIINEEPNNNFLKQSYEVHLTVQRLGDENEAIDKYEATRSILGFSGTNNPNLTLPLDSYLEECITTRCDLIGYKGSLFIQVVLVAQPRLLGLELREFPQDKWHLLIRVAIEKLAVATA